MADEIEELVAALTTTSISEDILSKVINFLDESDDQVLSLLILQNFQPLFTLEQWAWEMLSKDSIEWINQSKCFELFHCFASFNAKLVFGLDNIEPSLKASLLFPETKDLINDIFEQIEKINDENDPLFILISLWFDTLSYFIHEHTQFIISPIIIHLDHSIAVQFIMTDQYKSYLTQLKQPQTIFTHKQLFYIKTCSFSLGSYLFCKNQKFPFTGDQILNYFVKDYLEIIYYHSFNVESWCPELLSCITHIISFICICCWWSGEKAKCMKILLPSEEICHDHIQSLVRIISYKPISDQIQINRCNDQTILIDDILGFLSAILETPDLICFMRTETKLLEILPIIAETSEHNRITVCAYGLLGEILSDEDLKELKITNNLCGYFFYMLEQAWKSPCQKFQRIPVSQLLRGFLSLSKNDMIQQKTANSDKISLFADMCDKYPIVFDILWALSFNFDIQEQIRSNRDLMVKLTHLEHDLSNEQIKKSTHGILWNLQSNHHNRPESGKDDEIMFDIMISYSHHDKALCKQLYEELVKAGYRIWIDFDQMHGNVMDAMAQAIERSTTILICMSEQYRRSNYCRAEANYAFQRQLRIVPVLLQKNYKPDGWLLFLVGQLLYVDFTKNTFPRAMESLIKELKAPISKKDNVQHTELASNTNITVTNLLISAPTSLPPIPRNSILEWTQGEVNDWLIAHNLGQMSCLLCDYDGPSLIYLNKYLANEQSEQILTLLQEDALRKTNQSLSLVELARFRKLVDQQQEEALRSKFTKKRTKKSRDIRKLSRVRSCPIIMIDSMQEPSTSMNRTERIKD